MYSVNTFNAWDFKTVNKQDSSIQQTTKVEAALIKSTNIWMKKVKIFLRNNVKLSSINFQLFKFSNS